MITAKARTFQRRLLRWYDRHARDFPWREDPTPYKVLVAEMLLQRTGTEAAWPVFNELMARYPDIPALAFARLADLKRIMRPLGLFYRAGRLREIARAILRDHGGNTPETQKELLALPGVGIYGANAVLSLGFGRRYPIIDTNVRRVLLAEFPRRANRCNGNDLKLLELAGEILPLRRHREFNLALFDYAALVIPLRTRPKCPGLDCRGGCGIRAGSFA